jgi:hypothetical protein
MNIKLKAFRIPLLITAIYFIWFIFVGLKSFGFTSLIEDIPAHFAQTIHSNAPLLKGEKISAKFHASENNLGILLVRFVKFGYGTDTLIFRLKKEGEKDWYYSNTYSGQQFPNNQYYPIGFPPIPNSRDGLYTFEIESLAGTKQDGVGLSGVKPQASFVYSYSGFGFKKISYVLKHINYVQVIFVFIISYFFLQLKQNPKVLFKKRVQSLQLNS